MKILKKIFVNKPRLIILLGLFVIAAIATFYMIYAISLWHDIENVIRFILSILLLFFLAVIFVWSLKVLLRRKVGPFLLLLFLKIFYIMILFFLAFNINKIYTAIGRISSDTTVFSSSLVTIHSSANNIDEITNGKIGLYNNEASVDGYQLPKEIIEKRKITNEIVYFDGYIDILESLSEEEIMYAFLPTDYAFMFDEIVELEEILAVTRIIYTEEKEIALDREARQLNVDEPITFLLMGVDSTGEDVRRSTFNGDSLIVLTFNPKKMTMTMLSIPRDTYVPIACFTGERKNKITHAAWYGETCMRETIENFLDIKIDYTIKMNFLGLVNLVDAVGGVEVDVPYSFCEQDSQRRWGNHTIYVMEGLQRLDGEQALALTRNRKNNTHRCGYGVNWTNDFVRGQNQQLVLRALFEEFRQIRSLTTVQQVLEELGNTMETDLLTSEILSFYNVFRNVITDSRATSFDNIVRIQRLYLSGYDMTIHDYSQITGQGTRSNLYNFVPYQGSIDDVSEAMKINLGLKEREAVKTFSFNVNEPYEETVIGRGHYNEARMAVLPDFTNQNREAIINFANQNNLDYEFIEVANNGNYRSQQIVSQQPRPRTDLDYVTKIIIEIADTYESAPISQYIDCSGEAGLENCQFPNLIGKSYNEYMQVKNRYNLNWVEVVIDTANEIYDENRSLQIVDQNVDVGTDIYTLYGQTIIITYMAEKPTVETQD